MWVQNKFEYSYMKYLYNKPNFTSKNGLKMHKNRFYRHVKFKKILGGDPPNPLTREGVTPSRALHPLEPSAIAERLRRSIAVPLFKNRRRPWRNTFKKIFPGASIGAQSNLLLPSTCCMEICIPLLKTYI